MRRWGEKGGGRKKKKGKGRQTLPRGALTRLSTRTRTPHTTTHARQEKGKEKKKRRGEKSIEIPAEGCGYAFIIFLPKAESIEWKE